MENPSNVKLADPRAMQVQTIRCNTDYDSPEEYYIYDALLFRFQMVYYRDYSVVSKVKQNFALKIFL